MHRRAKPICCLTVLAGLLFSTLHAAVDVTLLEPQQYTRQRGAPTLFLTGFPGAPGTATLHVTNGDADGGHRVSSAVIRVNGHEVLGPSDFNQQVASLKRTFNVGETNTLRVELRSKPGSFLRIHITQAIDVEAAKVIGPGGGSLEVDDPSSPLFGASLVVPAGASDKRMLVGIKIASEQDPEADTITVALEPAGTFFDLPATLTLPLVQENMDSEPFILTYFFPDLEEFVPTPDIIDLEIGEQIVTSEIWHFSKWSFKKAFKYYQNFSIRVYLTVIQALNTAEEGVKRALEILFFEAPEACAQDPAGVCPLLIGTISALLGPPLVGDDLCVVDDPSELRPCQDTLSRQLEEMFIRLADYLQGKLQEMTFFDDFDDGNFTSAPEWLEVNNDDFPRTVEVINGELRFLTIGAGGNGGLVGVETEVDIPVSDNTLIVFDGKVVSRTVAGGCGFTCGEFPVNVQLELATITGEQVILRYALNFGNAIENKDQATFKQRAFSVPQNQWVRDIAEKVHDTWPEAVRITKIFLFGAGWSFDGFIDNIEVVN